MGLIRLLWLATCLLEVTMGFITPHTSLGISSNPDASKRTRMPSPPLVPSAASAAITRTQNLGSTSSTLHAVKGFQLADLFYDTTDMAFSAWEWTAGIGAPAALVAGAVLVTLSETREESAPRKNDPSWVRKGKMTMRFLLLSSFALEVISIFVSTMTGSVLLGHGPAQQAIGYKAPLQLLHHHHEFEFLTTQVCFLQGLLNWLGAVAIDLAMPKPSETQTAKRVNFCLASWLGTLIIFMLAFFNHHNTFYSDYGSMVKHLFMLGFKHYLGEFRPLSLLYVPAIVTSTLLTWRAFFKSPVQEDED